MASSERFHRVNRLPEARPRRNPPELPSGCPLGLCRTRPTCHRGRGRRRLACDSISHSVPYVQVDKRNAMQGIILPSGSHSQHEGPWIQEGHGAMSQVELMAHLMRRAGFGATREQLDDYAARGYEATVEELLHPGDEGRMGDDLIRRFHPEYSSMMGAQGNGGNWLYRMATTTTPLREKTALFWHGIFATGYPKVIHGKAPVRPDKDVQAVRDGRLPDLAGGAVQGPGDDHLAGQPGQPQGSDKRELRQGVAGAVLHGSGELHGAGHQGVRPGLHGMDDLQ